MKKLLGLVLVLALVGVMPAKADILKNLKSTGEIQVLGTNASKVYANDDHYGQVSLRVLYGLGFDLTEDVKANMTLAYYNMWGQDSVAGGGSQPSGHTGSSLQAYLDNVDVVEANVVLKNLFCSLEAKIGRQFYGDENSAIIYFGPNHYNSEQKADKQAMSLDAAKISYAGEMLAWDFVYAKVNDVDNPLLPGGSNSDANLWGLDMTGTLNDNLKIQGYFYQLRHAENAQIVLVPFTDRYVGIYGVKPSLTIGDLNISAEYARNVGGETAFDHDKGDMWKVDAALGLGAFTPRAQMFRANEFTSLGNYRPGLIVGQAYINNDFVDLLVFNLGVDMNFASMNKFTFSVDGYSFQDRNMKESAEYELDAWVKYQMNPNVELHLAAGGFHVNHIDNAYKAQAGMLVRF